MRSRIQLAAALFVTLICFCIACQKGIKSEPLAEESQSKPPPPPPPTGKRKHRYRYTVHGMLGMISVFGELKELN
jgi:hypothetical protein